MALPSIGFSCSLASSTHWTETERHSRGLAYIVQHLECLLLNIPHEAGVADLVNGREHEAFDEFNLVSVEVNDIVIVNHQSDGRYSEVSSPLK